MNERRREHQESPQEIFTRMFMDNKNPFSVRQAIQMLMFFEDVHSIDEISNADAEKFALMYDGEDGPAVKTYIEIYVLKQAGEGNVEKAVSFVKDAFDAFPEKIDLPKEEAVVTKRAA
ncbi:hypothetical protein HOF40_04090 [Candidatus Parcubacteria bacterium]|jgi:hypothetical protein|nr:hypothetical protein [Candidatus Parcubacteria bacterium]MBT3949242.1 hypothetical protein [Candidatus Parcubacteria bacterium]